MLSLLQRFVRDLRLCCHCSYGITHTMDEVFQAPGLVKHILKEEAGLPEVCVGTR